MRKTAIVVCLLLCSGFALCQEKSQPATADDVQKLVKVLRLRTQMEVMQASMMEQVKNGAKAGFLQQVPNASPELVAKVESIFGDLFEGVVTTDELVERVVPIYQKYLTHDDVEALVGFYSTPVGQHFLDLAPKMMQEGAAAGGALMQERMGLLQAKMEKKMQEVLTYVKEHPEAAGKSPAETTVKETPSK